MDSFIWLLSLSLVLIACGTTTVAAPLKKAVDVPFGRNYVPTWAFDHIKYSNGGSQVELNLDNHTGTGFQSKGTYLFGHFSMRIKMVGGDSAGVVTAYYLASQGTKHDEIDFEFLGNRTGEPYILQTNVFTRDLFLVICRFFLSFQLSRKLDRASFLFRCFYSLIRTFRLVRVFDSAVCELDRYLPMIEQKL